MEYLGMSENRGWAPNLLHSDMETDDLSQVPAVFRASLFQTQPFQEQNAGKIVPMASTGVIPGIVRHQMVKKYEMRSPMELGVPVSSFIG